MASGPSPCCVKICTTPPDELPYSDEKGPRSTSTRSAEPKSTCDNWPWPSGMVAGMPSTYKRTPRTPNVERAPKPRTESCRSCAWFCRSRASTPGVRARLSDRLSCALPSARNRSPSSTSTDAEVSNGAFSLRVTVTVTTGNCPANGCAVAEAAPPHRQTTITRQPNGANFHGKVCTG